jgi:hypothetical protein
LSCIHAGRECCNGNNAGVLAAGVDEATAAVRTAVASQCDLGLQCTAVADVASFAEGPNSVAVQLESQRTLMTYSEPW